MLHPGKILTKAYLAESVYESELEHDSNVIEVYINRLSKADLDVLVREVQS